LERKIDELTTLDSDLKEHIALLRAATESSEILYISGYCGKTTNPRFDTIRKTRFFRNFISNHKI
jgi:hypothetical protein